VKAAAGLVAALCFATASWAQQAAPPAAVDPGLGERWKTFVQGEIEHILAGDPYGSTFQLPKGYLKLAYKWSSLHGDSRYDGTGKLGPVIPPLLFQAGGQTQLNVDFGVAGHGGSHTFTVGYGILDTLGWFAEIPFNYMSVGTNLNVGTVDAQGDHIGATAASLLGVTDRQHYGPANFLYQTLPQLGRPPLGSSFRGEWLLGDVNTGVAWNYFRNSHMSSALTGRLFLPTAHIPPPERDILYATGPEIEAGTGGWGVAATQGYDWRLYRAQWLQLIAGSELSAGYHFTQHRPYPTNFIAPDPVAASLSPVTFPDLSKLSGDFTLTPGWALSWSARLDASIALLGLSAAYSVKFSQKPQLTGDPGFLGMVNSLGLLDESEAHTVQIAAGVSLIPFSIPARITVDWQRVVRGRNVLLYQDDFSLAIEGYIPTHFFLRH